MLVELDSLLVHTEDCEHDLVHIAYAGEALQRLHQVLSKPLSLDTAGNLHLISTSKSAMANSRNDTVDAYRYATGSAWPRLFFSLS